tara:strand:+ start:859 stop:990 length:132 start_codon:yes stop_codon:yes gene_type:complete
VSGFHEIGAGIGHPRASNAIAPTDLIKELDLEYSHEISSHEPT